MIFVDTGYLMALLRSSDSLHAHALSWSAHINGSFLITEYVLWELLNGLSATNTRGRAHSLVLEIRNSPEYLILPATPEVFEAGLQLYLHRPDKEWSLTDCISFHVMRVRGITEALAYDHHFEQAGFVALLRRDP